MKKRRAKKQKSAYSKIMVGISLVLVILLVAFINQKLKLKTIRKNAETMKTEQEELKMEINSLKSEMKNVNSLEFIEKRAREDLGMIKPNEKVYVKDND